MLLLRLEHIVDLFVWVDDLLPPRPVGPGRPAILTDSELVTLLVWNALVLHQRTLKDLLVFARLHAAEFFPKLPRYSAFVAHCHRVTPVLLWLLEQLLAASAPVRVVDSTMIPVCKNHRATRYRVARHLARWGKNHQGWHFGFKLHVAVTPDGQLCSVALTPANVHDAQVLPRLVNHTTRVAVGDTTYGASVMRRILWERYGTVVVAPPHPSQRRKLVARWQLVLLSLRPRVEATFDLLKEHLQLVTSFPRSPFGYLVHYVRVLLGYQLLAVRSQA